MDPCTLVIFGATGNLSRHKLMPSLYSLETDNRLPDKMSILAFGRRPWDRAAWIKEVDGMLKAKHPEGLDKTASKRFREWLHYFRGDLDDEKSFTRLYELFDKEDSTNPGNIIFYMAIRPAEFGARPDRGCFK